jgi:hypothetical protein
VSAAEGLDKKLPLQPSARTRPLSAGVPDGTASTLAVTEGGQSVQADGASDQRLAQAYTRFATLTAGLPV